VGGKNKGEVLPGTNQFTGSKRMCPGGIYWGGCKKMEKKNGLLLGQKFYSGKGGCGKEWNCPVAVYPLFKKCLFKQGYRQTKELKERGRQTRYIYR